jgi:hypothetical protein
MCSCHSNQVDAVSSRASAASVSGTVDAARESPPELKSRPAG